MHFFYLIATLSSLLLSVFTLPDYITISTCKPHFITKTVTHTVTAPSTHTTTTAAALHSPTAPYTVISVRSESPIHLLPLNAAGGNFYLGGAPATFCPLTNKTMCPPGVTTAFLGLGALDTEVPGGQLVYVATDGHLGFVQAHSATLPPGAVLSPLTYLKSPPTASFGALGTEAFGAAGFMGVSTRQKLYHIALASLRGTPERDGAFWQGLGLLRLRCSDDRLPKHPGSGLGIYVDVTQTEQHQANECEAIA